MNDGIARSDAQFKGPLFIIGMPRSGTKLVRDLLNGHSMIKVCRIETEFLPYWINHWQEYGDLSQPSSFQQFYNKNLNLPNFKKIHDSTDNLIEQWHDRCRDYTPAAMFEALVKCKVDVPEDSDIVWGDKSPSYINHLQLLKDIYPDARFIHIIRDARDFCISNHKAWRKNHLRAAERWVDCVSAACDAGRPMSTDYLEIHYETLIADTDTALQQCCEFLGLSYEPGMAGKAKLIEGRGDAQGFNAVKKDNTGKYRNKLSPQLLLSLEEVAGKTLLDLGYEVDYSGEQKRVPGWKMALLQLIDGYHLVCSRIANRGLFNAFYQQWQNFKASGNNN